MKWVCTLTQKSLKWNQLQEMHVSMHIAWRLSRIGRTPTPHWLPFQTTEPRASDPVIGEKNMSTVSLTIYFRASAYSDIYYNNLYTTPSRRLLRGTSDVSMAKYNSLKMREENLNRGSGEGEEYQWEAISSPGIYHRDGPVLHGGGAGKGDTADPAQPNGEIESLDH